MSFNRDDLQRNVHFKTSRSGGKGGQNVNKVSSKVELLFAITDSDLFTDDEKERLQYKLEGRINRDGFLQIVCDEERSQYLNKEIAFERLNMVLVNAMHVPKKRKKSKPSKAAVAARLNDKKRLAVKKANRNPPVL